MKFFFMLIRRQTQTPSPVLTELFDVLMRRGHQIESGIAEEMLVQPDQLAMDYDLVVLKSHTELSLSLASILHDRGGWLLNPYPACAAAQDKIFGAHRLRAADIPTPRNWVTQDAALLRSIAREYPLIIKPAHGFGGAGIHIVQPSDEFDLPMLDRSVLIQEYIPGNGQDLKVYVVGQRVFAVRKTFSETSSMQAGMPVQVSRQVEEIALRVGEIFGLGLYGIDLLESANGPVVVDVNYFPGYKGIPGIAPILADYIEDYACGRIPLETPRLNSQTRTNVSKLNHEAMREVRQNKSIRCPVLRVLRHIQFSTGRAALPVLWRDRTCLRFLLQCMWTAS